MNVICYATVEKEKKYQNNKTDEFMKQKRSKIEYIYQAIFRVWHRERCKIETSVTPEGKISIVSDEACPSRIRFKSYPMVSQTQQSCTFHSVWLFLTPFYRVKVCLFWENTECSPLLATNVNKTLLTSLWSTSNNLLYKYLSLLW